MNGKYRVLTYRENGRKYERFEHRVIAEKAVGHALPFSVQVHHRDENRRNNTPNNLVICEDGAYHKLLHYRTAAYRATGSGNAKLCRYCRTWDQPENVRWPKHFPYQVYHKACAASYQRERLHAARR